MPYESWVERQIREATERGEFDNLPGAGRPIPGLNGRDEPDWWVRGFLEREKISMPLPTSLALRREVANLPETLADVRPFLFNLFADPDIIRLPLRFLQRPLAWLISTQRP